MIFLRSIRSVFRARPRFLVDGDDLADFESVIYAINDVKEAIEQVSRRQEDFQNEVVKILKGIEHTIVDYDGHPLTNRSP